MTELLRQVVAQIEKLPAEQQDAIANRLLADPRVNTQVKLF